MHPGPVRAGNKLFAVPAQRSHAGSPSPATMSLSALGKRRLSMFFKKTASLMLLATPVVLAGQKPPATPNPVAIRPSLAIPHNPLPRGTGARFFVPPSTGVRPNARPVRTVAGRVLPVRQPTSPTGAEQQIARTSMTPAGAPAQRLDPPLIVPAAPPAPNADPAGMAAVEFEQGKLTIAANNADLGRVLKLIGNKTGAEIEFAPEIASEPVVARLGPGWPSEVLTALLTSPRIDFIVMGSDEEGQVRRVVVRKRASFGREPMAAAPTQPQTQEKALEQPGPRELGQQEQEKQP